MEIHERLRMVRKHLDKKQLEFADELGVSGTSYKNYEGNVTPVPSAVLIQLSKEYAISASWLLLGRGDMLEPSPIRLVKSAVLAAKTIIDEFGFKPDVNQEAELVCKMFRELYELRSK
ncbi:helix-turn-helix transcriptional regulator [Pseudovibrio sp. Ad37]|uniref:helix-turn-helix domain-containing protein n=1 Tax=Pseudovibrio sp. Ad37 TaxID=989422 RepID=UPI0007AE5A25|nr:helix-turn-helix transcriptional regulator [Pseudovibrio sp. Ad37]KZL24253.1 transcriptional repressor DicA [Pseudovibrio sp. Ad37]